MHSIDFYRVMHYSAYRGIGIDGVRGARLSVCDVVDCDHRQEILGSDCTDN